MDILVETLKGLILKILLEEGYDSVLLTISERGSIVLRFSGKYSSIFSFRSLDQFHRESEIIRGLGRFGLCPSYCL